MEWLQGLYSALHWQNLLFLFLGTTYGLIVGALPGIGATFGVASMLPLTFWLEPGTAIIFLAAIHASSSYGDSMASILINTPGGASSVASCWDGHPLARQGKAGFAMGISASGSTLGGIFGWVCLITISPLLVTFALMFGPAEYTMVALLALSLLSIAAQGDTIKGLILGGLGLMLSFVGFDPISGHERFSFGIMYLQDGVDIIPVTLGLFALSQAIALAREGAGTIAGTVSLTDRVSGGFFETLKHPLTVIRSAVIGVLLGVMPALGASTANIVAYFVEKKASRDPGTFGQGNPRGLIAPEVAKNSCIVADLIPTFSLGVPGSVPTALFMAALMIHGIAPGPEFFQRGELPHTVFMGILLAQLAFCIYGLLLARHIAKMVYVSNAILVPCIVVLCFLGAYSVRNQWLDVLVALIFGVLGYILSSFRYPAACLVLGLVLGQMLERNFQRSLIIGGGHYGIFVTKPISLAILIIIIAFLAWPYLAPMIKRIPGYLMPGQSDD